MAALTPTAQFTADNRSGNHYVITEVFYNASGDTVEVSNGAASAAVLVSSGTAPTASVAAGATSDTVTLTGGTTGVTISVVSLHSGRHASGLGAR